ncbi:hypothetical protein IOMTU157_2484 [Citrobacter portucalensis]|nr:hypothetical protein IOMTU157_2484 [Citrobacter portucalensis]SAD25538.1 type VI secretion system effector [Enterobacter cloacae]
MAIPTYLWLKDDGGADIKGSVDIHGREGSIEIIGLNHGVMQPTDKHNGKATSLRVHSPLRSTRRSTPLARISTRPLALARNSNPPR